MREDAAYNFVRSLSATLSEIIDGVQQIYGWRQEYCYGGKRNCVHRN